MKCSYFFRDSLLYKESSWVWDLSYNSNRFFSLHECLILISVWLSLLWESTFWTFWIFWFSEVEYSFIIRYLIYYWILSLFWQVWSRASWYRFCSCCSWSKWSSVSWELIELLNSFCDITLSWESSVEESSAFFWKHADWVVLIIFNKLFFLKVKKLEL